MEVDIPHLDSTITRLPADIRQAYRDRALNDLFFFNKGVLGFRDMTDRTHGDLCSFLMDIGQDEQQFHLVLMPRGTFKTHCGTIGGNMQRAMRDPNERILIANESATNAERFLRAIRQHLEGNRVLRALFSDIIPKDTRRVRWNDQQLELIREVMVPEPTFDTIGMTGASTSRHFTHLNVDDPISIEAVRSEKVMLDTIERLKTFTKLFVHQTNSTYVYIGTRWAFFDTVSWFENTYNPRRFIRACYDENGELFFPEFLSSAALQRERDTDEYLFSCNYLNRPRHPEAQELDTRLLKFSIEGEDSNDRWVDLFNMNPAKNVGDDAPRARRIRLADLDITVTVDLAPAESLTSDRNAITVCGVTPFNEVVVLHAWAKRCIPSEVMDELFRINEKYHPRVVGIEGVAYQKAFKFFLSDEMERRSSWFRVTEVRPERGGGGKRKPHIRGLQPLLKHGRLYLDPSQHMLRDEMADYPLGQHDDIVDSLAMHLRLMSHQVTPDFFARVEEGERLLLRTRRDVSLRRQLDLDEGEAVDLDLIESLPTSTWQLS